LAKSDILNQVEIEQNINSYKLSNAPQIIYLDEVDSTNNYARLMADKINSDFLVVADKQTLGKGRMGRSWSSPAGVGIFMSLCIKPEMAVEKTSMITLVTAVSLCDAIEELYPINATIKWPNDIVINSKVLS